MKKQLAIRPNNQRRIVDYTSFNFENTLTLSQQHNLKQLTINNIYS